MGRPKKVVESKPVYPVVTFGDVKFEIHPIADRDDDYAYDDAARFLALAIPVGSRVFNELIALGQNNQAAIDRIVKAQQGNEDQVSVIMDLVGLLAQGNFGTLLDDVSDVMPKLGAIACHYTDPDVSEIEVKRWCKGPLNKELWKAVLGQMKADNIMGQIASLQGMMGEFKVA